MEAVFTVDQIRRAEGPLLRAQDEPDELMRHAAKAVADAAKVMLAAPKPYFLGRYATRVLLLVGSGGNGGANAFPCRQEKMLPQAIAGVNAAQA